MSGPGQIIHTLLSACFHTMLHRNLGGSPACVSAFSSECLIEVMKRKCGDISLLKRGKANDFSASLHYQGFFSPAKKKKSTLSLVKRESFPSPTAHLHPNSFTPSTIESEEGRVTIIQMHSSIEY